MSAIELSITDGPRSSILVVDDDPLVSELIAKQFTEMPYWPHEIAAFLVSVTIAALAIP